LVVTGGYLDVSQLTGGSELATTIQLPTKFNEKQLQTLLFISGVSMITIPTEVSLSKGYTLQFGKAVATNHLISFKVSVGLACYVNYVWLSYVVVSAASSNITVLAGAVSVGWPTSTFSINQIGTMYGQYGVVFYGLSGFDIQSDENMSIICDLDKQFNLAVAVPTGSIVVSYLLMENNADLLCMECRDMVYLLDSYCVGQCTADRVAIPF
jgi:hypothetical protein